MRIPKLLLLAGLELSLTAGLAKAQYAGSVLYPMTPPNSQVTVNWTGQNTILAANGQTVNGYGHGDAAVWTSNGVGTDLYPTTPGGINPYSYATATDGVNQVGSIQTIGHGYAAMWSGTAGSLVDLDPNGIIDPGGTVNSSEALAISGNQEVGDAVFGGNTNVTHAVLWNGTAASAVDLAPTGATYSYATGTDGSQQVGYAGLPANTNGQSAILWTGTAASAVDLNPSGATSSLANAVFGSQEVGQVNHIAYLWNGANPNGVSLSAASLGMPQSDALGTNGAEQVGYGDTAGNPSVQEALLWTGRLRRWSICKHCSPPAALGRALRPIRWTLPETSTELRQELTTVLPATLPSNGPFPSRRRHRCCLSLALACWPGGVAAEASKSC
jgi:hypothetical protein